MFSLQEGIKVGGSNTISEILQQPDIWEKLDEIISNDEIEKIKKFIGYEKDVSIILSGAGSSEFVGLASQYFLKSTTSYNFKSIPTTSILSNPLLYLDKNQKLIYISFGRSGNSPESIACVELVDQLINDAYHIIITCNKDGQLANYSGKHQASIINLPSETHDLGFAMTSSYTSMYLSCLLLFKSILNQDIISLSNLIRTNTKKIEDFVLKINTEGKKRLVYLGSDDNEGIAREGALKVLELTSGKVLSFYNTPLAFRHGPKSLVNSETITMILMSSEDYPRAFEFDLINELVNDGRGNQIVVIDVLYDPRIENLNVMYFSFDTKINQGIVGIAYLYLLQLFAYNLSVKSQVTPDSPSSDESVNRVVKGVVIHKYVEDK